MYTTRARPDVAKKLGFTGGKMPLHHGPAEYNLKWIEEALPPDDYWGYAKLKKQIPPKMLVTTGEHEATRCADILQPNVGWCRGITELTKISAMADAAGALMIPHGSSVYSYHFVLRRTNSPFAGFLMMHALSGK